MFSINSDNPVVFQAYISERFVDIALNIGKFVWRRPHKVSGKCLIF